MSPDLHAMTPPDDADDARVLRAGLEQFNEGRWFEAHETWEQLWHAASGSRKRFYQGLIQCAVALEHARRGNPRGVRSVWGTCVGKFAGLGPAYMGVDIAGLLEGMRRAIGPVLELPEPCFDPALPRGQPLPVDWSGVPRLTLAGDAAG